MAGADFSTPATCFIALSLQSKAKTSGLLEGRENRAADVRAGIEHLHQRNGRSATGRALSQHNFVFDAAARNDSTVQITLGIEHSHERARGCVVAQLAVSQVLTGNRGGRGAG